MSTRHAPTRRRTTAALTAVLAAGLMLTGCARGTGAEQSSADVGDGAERVAALGLGDADTLLALGVTPVVVAPWGAEGDGDPSGVGPWAFDALGDADPVPVYGTATGFTADIVEQVAAADPAQIIAVNAAVDRRAQQDLERIAPVTVHPSEHADWQVPWEEQVDTIAEAVGEADRGRELIAESEQVIADFREDHPELQGKSAAVVMPYAGKLGLYTAGDGRGAMIEKLGFTIPDELQETADGSFYRDIAPENYRDLDQVDYLFVLDYGGAVDALRADPTFQDLDIVDRDRVVYLDEDTGNAMSMPNPLTIPFAVERVAAAL